MGRKCKGRVLDVYVGSSKVGRYSRSASGSTSFRYVPDWLSFERAFPISLSMPLSDRVWSGENTTSYFDGLLPDDHTVKEKIAAREHADSASIFDLLAVIGRDCVGALRFIPEGLDPGDPTKWNICQSVTMRSRNGSRRWGPLPLVFKPMMTFVSLLRGYRK